MNKWVKLIREETHLEINSIIKKKIDKNEKSKLINTIVKNFKDKLLDDSTKSINDVLGVTYGSYVVMLECRNKVWPYEYMSFSRRIGELWEPFCKIPFIYSKNGLKIISPPDFTNIQSKLINDFVSAVEKNILDKKIANRVLSMYRIPWSLVDSGGIKLDLDLHFSYNGYNYNCDFKSGFSSNEKGNTNRLLMVGSIFNQISNREKMYIFVRQKEDENNHYLQTLKNSNIWNVLCADSCYDTIKSFTNFDLKKWILNNMNWQDDFCEEFRKYLINNDLIKYLTW